MRKSTANVGATCLLSLERSLRLIQDKTTLCLSYPGHFIQKPEVISRSREGTKTVPPDVITQDIKVFKPLTVVFLLVDKAASFSELDDLAR